MPVIIGKLIPCDPICLKGRHMATGTVKWFNHAKGFGFIVPDDGGRDVFVHISTIESSGMQGLNEGQKINFEAVEEPKGMKAVELSSAE